MRVDRIADPVSVEDISSEELEQTTQRVIDLDQQTQGKWVTSLDRRAAAIQEHFKAVNALRCQLGFPTEADDWDPHGPRDIFAMELMEPNWLHALLHLLHRPSPPKEEVLGRELVNGEPGRSSLVELLSLTSWSTAGDALKSFAEACVRKMLDDCPASLWPSCFKYNDIIRMRGHQCFPDTIPNLQDKVDYARRMGFGASTLSRIWHNEKKLLMTLSESYENDLRDRDGGVRRRDSEDSYVRTLRAAAAAPVNTVTRELIKVSPTGLHGWDEILYKYGREGYCSCTAEDQNGGKTCKCSSMWIPGLNPNSFEQVRKNNLASSCLIFEKNEVAGAKFRMTSDFCLSCGNTSGCQAKDQYEAHSQSFSRGNHKQRKGTSYDDTWMILSNGRECSEAFCTSCGSLGHISTRCHSRGRMDDRQCVDFGEEGPSHTVQKALLTTGMLYAKSYWRPDDQLVEAKRDAPKPHGIRDEVSSRCLLAAYPAHVPDDHVDRRLLTFITTSETTTEDNIELCYVTCFSCGGSKGEPHFSTCSSNLIWKQLRAFGSLGHLAVSKRIADMELATSNAAYEVQDQTISRAVTPQFDELPLMSGMEYDRAVAAEIRDGKINKQDGLHGMRIQIRELAEAAYRFKEPSRQSVLDLYREILGAATRKPADPYGNGRSRDRNQRLGNDAAANARRWLDLDWAQDRVTGPSELEEIEYVFSRSNHRLGWWSAGEEIAAARYYSRLVSMRRYHVSAFLPGDKEEQNVVVPPHASRLEKVHRGRIGPVRGKPRQEFIDLTPATKGEEQVFQVNQIGRQMGGRRRNHAREW